MSLSIDSKINWHTNVGNIRAATSFSPFFALLFAAFYLPVLFIFFGIIPFAFRFYVLVGIALVLFLFAKSRGISFRELGFRCDNLWDSLLANLALLVVLGGAMLAFLYGDLIDDPTSPTLLTFGIVYVFVSCPAQEFSCRGFLFAEMNRWGMSAPARIIISSISYGFLHIIYRDWLTFLVTVFMGIVWGVVYWRYPNLWGVILSHAILGLISLAVGLV